MIFDEMEFGSYDKAERKVRKAYELYEDGKMVQALDELDGALEINPANSAWHFNKALTLDSMSRFEEAIAEYEAALQLSPEDVEILNSLAVDYTRTGQYDLAIDTFEHIQQTDPEFEPCYCNRIIAYTEMGLHDQAEQMFYLAQQIKPDCALCYYNIGNSLFAREEYKKAVGCWLRTADLDPTHPQINYRIAQAYWSDGDLNRARQQFLLELRENPGDTDVILDFGLFLLEQEQIDAAREKFNRILEMDPDFAPAMFYLGEIERDAGCRKEAASWFEKAQAHDEKLPGVSFRLAQCALADERPDEVKSHLVSELKRWPESTEVLVAMGAMFAEIDEPNYATHCLLRALELDRTNADANYYLGLISARQAMFDDALRFFRQALESDEHHLGALVQTASACLQTEKLDQAWENISKAHELSGDEPTVRTLYGRIRMARMRRRLAGPLGRFKISRK